MVTLPSVAETVREYTPTTWASNEAVGEVVIMPVAASITKGVTPPTVRAARRFTDTRAKVIGCPSASDAVIRVTNTFGPAFSES